VHAATDAASLLLPPRRHYAAHDPQGSGLASILSGRSYIGYTCCATSCQARPSYAKGSQSPILARPVSVGSERGTTPFATVLRGVLGLPTTGHARQPVFRVPASRVPSAKLPAAAIPQSAASESTKKRPAEAPYTLFCKVRLPA